MSNLKMLRTLILISAFLPNMMTANHRDLYLYSVPPTPEKSTEKPVIERQAGYLPNYQYPHNIYYTTKPINRPIIEPESKEQKKPYKVPEFTAIPFFKDNTIPENSYNPYKNDITNNFDAPVPKGKPDDFESMYPEKPDNKPDEYYSLPDSRPKRYQSPSVKYSQKKEEERYHNFPYFQTPDQDLPIYSLPLTHEKEKQFQPEFHEPKPVLTERPVNNIMVNDYSSSDDEPDPMYDYEPEIYTEKPRNKLISNKIDTHKPNLPILTEPVCTGKMSKEDLIKKRLVSLILSSKKDLEKHIQDIERIHDSYKSGTMYKIGYLTSLINKANESLGKLYKNVENKHHKWDALRVLDTYEEVKSESELIQNLLRVMLTFMKAKHRRPEQPVLKGPGQRAVRPGISWSYYDDTMP